MNFEWDGLFRARCFLHCFEGKCKEKARNERFYWLVLLLWFLFSTLYSATISGVVSNESNGQPIEFATIVIKETQQGAYTNNKGYYVITDVRPGSYNLVFSMVGFAVTEKEVVVLANQQNVYVNAELKTQGVQMETITVTGTRDSGIANTREIQIGRVHRTTRQLLDVVQVAEPDVFRSIMTLPGVTPIADFSSGMYVRGGSPDQNQILLDDIEVYNPLHFGGLFSAFNTDAVNSVELLKGGFPAKYGGRLASVLDVRNRDGNRKYHQGVARVSLLSAQATLEGPWHIGQQSGSYMGSFRRTYLDLMRQFIDIIPDYYFYDGHLKFNWDIGQNDKLSVSTYFGYDKLDMDIGARMYIDWGNNVYSAQWVHIFNPQLFSHFVLANSKFSSEIIQETGDSNYTRLNQIDDYTLKGMMSYKPNNAHLFEFGFEAKINNLDFINEATIDVPPDQTPVVTARSLTTDIYVQDSWLINPKWTLQPGVRVSNHQTLEINLPSSPKADYTRFSPRVSLRRKLTPDSNVFVSYGRYYQFLNLISPGISTPMDVWVPLDATVKPGVADHYIVGYKHDIRDELALDIEVYYKDMNHLTEYNRDSDNEWSNATYNLSNVLHTGKGDAKGVDVLLRTDWKGWEGFLGYSFCLTRKKINGMNLNPQTGKPEYFYPLYDKNHQISIVQSWNMTSQTGWQLWGADLLWGVTYAYATGQPTSKPEKLYYAGDHWGFMYSYADADRLPYYSRLDLSFKMQWNKESYTIEPYLQVINVFDRVNVFNRRYIITANEANELQLSHEDFGQFPLIPFIGVNVQW